MRKFQLILALAGLMGTQASAADLPFTADFNSGLSPFVETDANDDGVKFSYNSYSGQSYSGCAIYNGSATNQADDWMFSPTLAFKKGLIYELRFSCKVGMSNKTNRLEIKAGDSASPEAMTHEVMAATDYAYNNNNWETVTLKLLVPTDGDYVLGFHLISDAGQGTFYLDNISVDAGLSPMAPVAPTVSAPSFSVADDNLRASFDVTLPAVDAAGNALSGDITLRAKRSDDVQLDPITGAPGAKVTFVDNNASTQAVTYTFECVKGEETSPAVEVNSNPTFGIPLKVENLEVTQNGGEFTINWSPVTEAINASYPFLPKLVTYTVKCGKQVIAENISETTATFTAPLPEEGQDALSFSVTANLGNRSSEAANSGTYMVGNPYKGEFAESFANFNYSTRTWIVASGSTDWQTSVGNSYSPVINPQDGDGGMLQFSNSSEGNYRISSPLIDLDGLSNPILKFWYFQYPSGSKQYSDAIIQPLIICEGTDMLLGDQLELVSGTEEGWTEISFPIPAEAAKKVIQIAFDGIGGNYGKFYLDNISIKDYLAHNLAAEIGNLPGNPKIGEKIEFPVEVVNKGVNAEEDYSVILYVDDEKVSEIDGIKVAAMSSETVMVPFTVLPRYAGQELSMRVEVALESDLDRTDNTAEFKFAVGENDLPLASDLTAESTKEHVKLTWKAPEVASGPTFGEVTESFESWTAGSMNPEGDWIFVDADGIAQKGVNGVNTAEKFAAMVAENFTNKTPWGETSFKSSDGSKCLAITPANSYGGQIDNWIISPLVKGGTEVSFQTMVLYDYSVRASIQILTSEGGTAPEDFEELESRTILDKSWTEVSFELPENAQRFAIRVTAISSGDALMFDAFRFTGMTVPPVHTGYNLYRDHMLLATLPAEATEHLDTEASTTMTHVYHVTALYDKGESHYSNEARGGKTNGTGIDSVTDGVRVTAATGEILIEGANGENVVVCEADGKVLFSGKVQSEARISCAPGIKIVRIGSTAIKLTVK